MQPWNTKHVHAATLLHVNYTVVHISLCCIYPAFIHSPLSRMWSNEHIKCSFLGSGLMLLIPCLTFKQCLRDISAWQHYISMTTLAVDTEWPLSRATSAHVTHSSTVVSSNRAIGSSGAEGNNNDPSTWLCGCPVRTEAAVLCALHWKSLNNIHHSVKVMLTYTSVTWSSTMWKWKYMLLAYWLHVLEHAASSQSFDIYHCQFCTTDS